MVVLKQYIDLTKEVIALMKAEDWNTNREFSIERLNQILTDREQLQAILKPPFSAEEQTLGRKCVALNEELNQLLNDRKHDIKQDIQRVQAQKQHNTKYANPYESMETDGYYYDKRK